MNWINKPSLDIARSHPAIATHQDKIYLFGGGGSEFKSLNSTVVFDPGKQSWRVLKSMPSLRSGSVAVCYKDKIYVAGGGFKQANGQFRFLTTVEIYDPLNDSWEQGPDLIHPHDYPAVVLFDKHLYVMGGHHPKACEAGPKTDPGFDFCERLNLETLQWEAIATLPTPRFALAALVYEDKILSFGGVAFTPEGFNNFDFVEVYDAQKNVWNREQKYQLPWQAAGLAACLHHEEMYIFGGYSGDGIHAKAAVFRQGKWLDIEPMLKPRAAMAVASVEQGIYMMGGWADDGRTPVNDVDCYQN